MSKHTFTPEQLSTLSAEQIIDDIQHRNYSLLKSLGAEKLRTEMVPVGKICHLAINYFLDTTGPKDNPALHSQHARAKLVKTLSKLTPGSYSGFPTSTRHGLVVGFNHPSLGEIARILTMKIDLMGSSIMLFPVNLPWYEALAPDFDKIKQLGILITPTISPSTWRKMALAEGTPEHTAGLRLKGELRSLYIHLARTEIKHGGVIFVAPSATRQATVFADKAVYDRKKPIIPTLSILALELYQDPAVRCDFLPMSILPPDGYKRSLNFFKRYQLIPGQPFTAANIRKNYLENAPKNATKLPDFDYDFHRRLASNLPKKFWY